MDKELYDAHRELSDSGLTVRKERMPPMNAGGKSETVKHIVGKTLVAYIAAAEHGYQSDLEVPTDQGKEIDCLLWGHPRRLTYAVELEHSPTEETKQKKLKQYVKAVPAVDDMLLINLNEMPVNMLDARAYLREETGL